MASLDTKMTFTLKDLIMLVGFLSAGFGGYYAIDGRIVNLESSDSTQNIEIAELKEANKAIAGLPKDVQKMQLDIEKNGKTLQIIYFGLVAKDIIPPPK